jgi:chitodextrinase
VTAYEGVDNCVRVNGLTPTAVYRFRVAAVNARGGAGLWSEATQVRVLARSPDESWPHTMSCASACVGRGYGVYGF